MLINLRNALMAGKRLPYDAEVEYLESTGTQWIDTGIGGSSLSRINLTASGDMRNQAWLGCGTGQTSGDRLLVCTHPTNSPATVACRMDGTIVHTNVNCESATVIEADIANRTLTANGVTTPVPFSGSISDKSLYLFAANYESLALVSNGHRIYSVKFYSLSGTLVRDFIPVRKGTVGYLCDRVSGKLFGNAGTGDFVLGPDVVPVEYIESRGTEYIDTGVKLRSTDTIDTRLYINSSSTAGWYGILGARDAERYLCVRCYSGNDGLINATSPGQNIAFSRYTWGNLSFAFGGDYHETTTNCYLFAYNDNGSLPTRLPYRFANFSITRDSSKIINFLPVRVGTDATSWEGAMMDVLTRRIYRNAGTGAFTYGNDLKYPIPAS